MKRRIVWGKYQPHNGGGICPMKEHVIHIFNETTVRIPRTLLAILYNDLLRQHCSLNVLFIDSSFSKRLNIEHRNKNTPADVLSFPPNDDNIAEIYIDAVLAARMAKSHHISIKCRILFLYIHGILHLLGHRHGEVMELLEDKYVTRYVYGKGPSYEAKKERDCFGGCE